MNFLVHETLYSFVEDYYMDLNINRELVVNEVESISLLDPFEIYDKKRCQHKNVVEDQSK